MASLTSIRPPRSFERGGVSWVSLVLLLAVSGATYLAIMWGPVYVTHYEVRQVVRDFMNQALKNRDDSRLVADMCGKLASLEKIEQVDAQGKVERVPVVQIAPEDVTWERDTQTTPPTLRVAFEYTRQVHYPFITREPKEWTGVIEDSKELAVPDWGPSR
jgi:hypothetical protein